MSKPPLNDVTAVVFDFDGTLAELVIDFPPLYERLFALMDRYGIDRTRLSERYLIELIDEAASILGDGRGREFYDAATKVVVDEEIKSAENAALFPGTRRLLSTLREKDIRVGIVTRNSEAAVRMIFPDVETAVDAFIPRERTTRLKPHPGHLALALELLGTKATHTAMVGDHPIDIESGRIAGMIPVGVTTGKVGRDALLAAGAALVLTSADELEQYFLDS